MSMTTSTRQVGDVTIVNIKGRIIFGDAGATLHDVITGLLSKGRKQILFDLSAVEYIDSMGMGCLVGAFTSVRKQGGELKLLKLSDKVAEVMQITKLYTVFDIVNDETAGVKSFGKSKAARKS